MKQKDRNKILILLIVLILAIATAAIIYFFMGKNENSNQIKEGSTINAPSAQNSNSANAQKNSLKSYDGKILAIYSSDGKINGQAWIKYVNESGKENLEVRYNMFLNDALKINGTCGGNEKNECGKMIRYEYDHKILSKDENKYLNGATAFPAVCNKNQQIANPDASIVKFYGAEACGVDYQVGAETSTFVLNGKIKFQSYNNIIQYFKITIIDSSKFWNSTQIPGSTDPNEKEYRVDQDRALREGPEIKTYIVKISEKQ